MDFLRIYIGAVAFLAGACIGSFLNCAADRYAEGQSVLKGRSRCPVCGRTLGIPDLIPVLSYLFLRGRCRGCGARIPVRCLFTELLGGLLWLTTFCAFGFRLQTLQYLLLFSALFVIALIDGDTMEIPDGLTLFCLVCYVAFVPFEGDLAGRLYQGLLGAAAIGGGMLVVSLLMDFLLKRETLGGGDVKLFFVLGFYTGLWKGLLMLILACIVGLAFALAFRKAPKKEFPFGPAIVIAAVAVLLAGQPVIDAYLSLLM